MKDRIGINTYRLRKLALQMREFTINELKDAAGASKETTQSFVFGLRQKKQGLLESENVPAQRPGRPLCRYRLTREGIEHLTQEIAPFAFELNETAFAEDPSLRPSLPKPQSESPFTSWRRDVAVWLDKVALQFEKAVERGASAIFLKPGEVCTARIGEQMKVFPEGGTWSIEDFSKLMEDVLTSWQRLRLETRGWTACAYRCEERPSFEMFFRMVSGKPVVALRPLPTRVPTIEELHLSPLVSDISTQKSGLILVSGITGSGRSRILAAIIDQINAQQEEHITTIEEPVRYFHERQKSFIEQRQVAIDTPDFSHALEEALAAKSDVVVLGEVTDSKMFGTVLAAAERLLMLCRITAPSPAEAVIKLIDLFPEENQAPVRARLAANLAGIISVTALPSASGKETVSAAEVLPWHPAADECILDPAKTSSITECLLRYDKSTVTLEKSVRELYKKGAITRKVAAHHVKGIKNEQGERERLRWPYKRKNEVRKGQNKNQHVVPIDRKWGVCGEGNERLTSIHARQSEAIEAAREIARNQRSELIIHGRDGLIRERDSYGNDQIKHRDRKQ